MIDGTVISSGDNDGRFEIEIVGGKLACDPLSAFWKFGGELWTYRNDFRTASQQCLSPPRSYMASADNEDSFPFHVNHHWEEWWTLHRENLLAVIIHNIFYRECMKFEEGICVCGNGCDDSRGNF